MPTATHPITHALSAEEIQGRLAALGDAPVGPVLSLPDDGNDVSPDTAFRYYAPFEDAANEYVRFSQTSERRIYTGIPEFDGAMRGVAPKELCLINGFAHSGKTVFATKVMQANQDKRGVLFTPDETRVLVLVKLACAQEGVSAEHLEDLLARGDDWAEDLLRRTATETYPNLAVFDELSSLDSMSFALDECAAAWGDDPQYAVIDYADLIETGAEDPAGRLNAIKRWGKKHDLPLFLLHQTSRTAGADGRKMTISSGNHGGEQQATFVVGVRRKRNQYESIADDLRLRIATSSKDTDSLQHQLADAEYEIQRHRNTITFSLVKNKRPPGRLVEDTDFRLDPDTGAITPLGYGGGEPLLKGYAGDEF